MSTREGLGFRPLPGVGVDLHATLDGYADGRGEAEHVNNHRHGGLTGPCAGQPPFQLEAEAVLAVCLRHGSLHVRVSELLLSDAVRVIQEVG